MGMDLIFYVLRPAHLSVNTDDVNNEISCIDTDRDYDFFVFLHKLPTQPLDYFISRNGYKITQTSYGAPLEYVYAKDISQLTRELKGGDINAWNKILEKNREALEYISTLNEETRIVLNWC